MVADLTRMRAASDDLGTLVNRVVDTPETIPNELEAIEAFRKRLRHDLRTPLNTIKGFAAMLFEDLRASPHKDLLTGLEKILTAADELRVQIDALVDRTGQSDIEPRLNPARSISMDRAKRTFASFEPKGVDSKDRESFNYER